MAQCIERWSRNGRHAQLLHSIAVSSKCMARLRQEGRMGPPTSCITRWEFTIESPQSTCCSHTPKSLDVKQGSVMTQIMHRNTCDSHHPHGSIDTTEDGGAHGTTDWTSCITRWTFTIESVQPTQSLDVKRCSVTANHAAKTLHLTSPSCLCACMDGAQTENRREALAYHCCLRGNAKIDRNH